MFRENTLHTQEELFNNLSSMDPRFKKRLEKSWAGLFYKHLVKLMRNYLLLFIRVIMDVLIFQSISWLRLKSSSI